MYKKLLSIICIFSLIACYAIPVQATCNLPCEEQTIGVEHLDVHKKAPCNLVTIKTTKKVIEQGNVLLFQFNEKFYSKCVKAGDIVHFDVPEALYTCEGTLLFPCGTKVVAEVTQVEKPKWFNKNARVSIIFRQVQFPDGTCYGIKARPFTDDYKLKEGPWVTAGKILASTITFGIIGTGAGIGFGFIPTPTRLGVGLAAGIPAGCGLGFILGVVTPGCHFKAKKGENLYAILIEEMPICNQ